jgi:NAD(P)-dependent dehydrogenase (short-subunit alcohol dehydrogenase family)
MDAQAASGPAPPRALPEGCPFTSEDLAAAIRVLESAGRDKDLFASKPMRALRKAVQPLVALQQASMFGGKAKEEYADDKDKRKRLAQERRRAQLEDREHLTKTTLRAGRMQKLQALLSQGGGEGAGAGAGALPLVLDGVAEDVIPGTLLEDARAGGSGSEAAGATAASTARTSRGEGGASMATDAGGHDDEDDEDEEEEEVADDGDGAGAGAAASSAAKRGAGGSSRGMEDDEDEAEGAGAAGASASSSAAASGAARPKLLNFPRACYICKRRFRELHHFYDTLCPPCSELNWRKRHQIVDLRGRVAIVTGSRVKIGFQCCLRLLRCGASVIATTRFPHDAAERFAAQPDSASWLDRLHVYGLDMRDLGGVEAFCAMVLRDYPRLDAIVNNACQTVRRPPAFFAPLIARETAPLASLPDRVRGVVERDHAHQAERAAWARAAQGLTTAAIAGEGLAGMLADAVRTVNESGDGAAAAAPATAGGAVTAGASASTASSSSSSSSSSSVPVTALPSALQSQLALVQGDEASHGDTASFPTGMVDVNGQQLDLRRHHSWRLRLHEVETPELVEVFAINSAAPFILNARLKPLMMRGNEDVLRAGVKGAPAASASGGASAASSSSSSSSDGAGGSGATSLAEAILAQTGEDLDVAGADGAAARMGGTARGAPVGGANKRPRREVGGGAIHGDAALHRVPAPRCRFIVNVSAMEGKFYRAKTPAHPHTNMAKAALNMMTRTSAGDYAETYIYMTAVDTGWVNDENPAERAAMTAARNNFATPIDEVDAAARVLDPILAPLAEAAVRGDGTCAPQYGCFLKDYFVTEW